MPDEHIVSVKVWGDLACFTRPELKVERFSYPIMTPSAARGVLDAILFKKKTDPVTGRLGAAFHWHVRRITALRPWTHPQPQGSPPYQTISIRRNEIQGKIAPKTINASVAEHRPVSPYIVDSAGRESVDGQNRTQRNTLALSNVAYLIEASIDMDHWSDSDPPVKYREMFVRRTQKGQCFQRPYLGCREFACDFAPVDGSEHPLADWNEDLGLMLYDVRFGEDGRNWPGYFQARIRKGVLHCDTADPGPQGEPPVAVVGWPEQH
jgi:CRISPR-associated protein Cas5d